MTANCALHFDVPSMATCARCGRFCCSSCLRQDYVCNDCGARLAAELPSLQGRGDLARYGLWATAVCHALMLAFAAAELATGPTSEAGEGPISISIFSGLAALAYLVVYIVTIVLVCRWFHLAARHALARGAQLGSTPAGAVGSWFIPFVNLARPFQLTRQMLTSANVSPDAVGGWQALWILGNITANVSQRVPDAAGLGVGIVSDALLIVAAVLFAKVIASLRFN